MPGEMMPDPFHIPTIDEIAPAKPAPRPAETTPAPSHTPGPWVLHLDGPLCLQGDPADTIPDSYREIVAGSGYFTDGGNTGFSITSFFTEHDARLIAAAPDLLTTMQSLREFVAEELENRKGSFLKQNGEDAGDADGNAYIADAQLALSAIDAAIAKATGAAP